MAIITRMPPPSLPPSPSLSLAAVLRIVRLLLFVSVCVWVPVILSLHCSPYIRVCACVLHDEVQAMFSLHRRRPFLSLHTLFISPSVGGNVFVLARSSSVDTAHRL